MQPKADLRDYLAVERTFLAWIRTGLSLWFGTALIVAGILVQVSAAWRHTRLARQLQQGDTDSSRSLSYAVATALFLAAVGLAMAVYVLSVRST